MSLGLTKCIPPDCEGGSGNYYFGGWGAYSCVSELMKLNEGRDGSEERNPDSSSGLSELMKLNEGRDGSEERKPDSSSGSLSLGSSNSGSSIQ